MLSLTPRMENGRQIEAQVPEKDNTVQDGLGPCMQGRHLEIILDHSVLAAFAISAERFKALKAAVHEATDLCKIGALSQQLVVYGSVSIERAPSWKEVDDVHGTHDMRCYATNLSDVDIAVLVADSVIAQGIVEGFRDNGWCEVHCKSMPRLAVAQSTLVSHVGVHLDLACISDANQFQRFRARKEAFEAVFSSAHRHMQTKYGMPGGLAFDGYIYLLKAFAAFASRTSCSSFQAVCLGLFVLRRLESNWRCLPIVPTALLLFEKFLRFCCAFFSDGPRYKAPGDRQLHGHRMCAIDLSGEGRLLRRISMQSSTEMYFAEVERRLCASSSDWSNVLHNFDPGAIKDKAEIALKSWYNEPSLWKVWGSISQDLCPMMQ